MNALMMSYQLTLPAILRRAEQLYPHKEIVTRLPDRSIYRYAYSDFVSRAKKLAVALKDLDILGHRPDWDNAVLTRFFRLAQPGDRGKENH